MNITNIDNDNHYEHALNAEVARFIDARVGENMTAREIFAAAQSEGQHRGFTIRLAAELIQTGRFVL